MDNKLDNISHDYLRYANCWEDADLLLKEMNVSAGSRILSIASAGDNSFSLLTKDPSKIVAVDLNLVQLYLVELKKAAFKSCTYTEFIQFLGFSKCENRLSLFNKLVHNLEINSKRYWEQHLDEIERGIIYEAKFEKYFLYFSRKIVPIIHNKTRVNKLFEEKSLKEQQYYFSEKFNTWRWRLLFKIFFSKYVMGKFGRDPKFMEEVDLNVGSYIFQKTSDHMSSELAQKNHFLDFIMRGKFNIQLPHYAREQNFQIIKSRVDRLSTYHGKVEDVKGLGLKFDAFNLSNIFEYLPKAYCLNISKDLEQLANENAIVLYWNLMVDRNLSNLNTAFESIKVEDQKDLGFFYKKMVKNIL